MTYIEILLISVALAMDAFAVAVCKGLSMRTMNWKKAVIIGAWFGVFQGVMPTIGYFLGSAFEGFITSIDHWVAFVLLALIGGSMAKEALSKEEGSSNDDVSFIAMIVLALATSIDALAVGIAYVCAYGSNRAPIAFSIIAVVTFFISLVGVKIGNRFGNRYEKKAQLTGGIILILLGLKILLEHLGFITF